MKERPILFSTDMVRAILDGRKTMTRRIIKPQPILHDNGWEWKGTRPKAKINSGSMAVSGQNIRPGSEDSPLKYRCPYGQPGDILWVREPFYKTTAEELNGQFFYKASLETFGWSFKYKPAIHMPKAAARIWLQVSAVKVERLQEISDQDALCEGIKHVIDKVTGYCGYDYLNRGYNLMTTPYDGFKSLWRSIHGHESWEQNPWVWVISFKVLSTTGIPTDL